MSSNNDLISIEDVSRRFEEHLNIDGNNRIIFSGKFGTGKTFFLNEFFDDKNDNYNKVLISPVNYVVNSNEDIFELIKADIIRDLFFTKKIELTESIKHTKGTKVNMFVGEKPQHFIKFLTSSLKKVNPFFEIADDFYDSLNILYSKYKEYESILEKELKANEDELDDFLNSYLDIKGTFFEYDFITRTITQTLKQIKGQTKKNILVIDDLDRLDPDHIFRILNILSVHNNSFGTSNKFEFDYVIIVCDIENIKKIFEHKYGAEVDFDGYIDKFYATDIFKWENIDAIKFYINSLQFDDDRIKPLLSYLLLRLVENNSLTLRKLIKYKIKFSSSEKILSLGNFLDGSHYNLHHQSFINFRSSPYISSKDLPLLKTLRIVTFLFGDFKNFYVEVEKLKKIKDVIDYVDIKNFINLIAFEFHIATAKGNNVYFSKYYDDNHSDLIIQIGYPTFNFLGIDFRINLDWRVNNVYNGSKPYFENAQTFPLKSIVEQNSTSEIKISEVKIFDAIDTIIQSYNQKGWLKQENIFL